MNATRDYHAPMHNLHHVYQVGAWKLDIGTTADGTWIVDYWTPARPTYQRTYHDTEQEALTEVRTFGANTPPRPSHEQARPVRSAASWAWKPGPR